MGNSTQMSAKDRITALLDDNSFVEIGALVTKRNTDFDLPKSDAPSDGVITGYGLIDGSLVYVYSQDAKVLHGTIGEMHAKKIVKIIEMADRADAPIIGAFDSAGAKILGGFTVGEYSKIGAGAVVLKEVPPYATVVGVPGKIVKLNGEKCADLEQEKTDPVVEELCHLREKIFALEEKIEQLTNKKD